MPGVPAMLMRRTMPTAAHVLGQGIELGGLVPHRPLRMAGACHSR